jgi:hypothetical protein
MRKTGLYFRSVILAATVAAGSFCAPAHATSIILNAPGCTAGGVLSWNAATKSVYCLGAPAVSPGNVIIVTPDCVSGTQAAWEPATTTVYCQTTSAATTPAASLQITFSLPDCTVGAVAWVLATRTLTCAAHGPAASVTTFSGGGQSAAINKPFDNSLIAIVRDANNYTLAGIPVLFHVPASGASATMTTASVLTDSNGLARMSVSANSAVGGFAATATVAGLPVSAGFGLTNTATAVQAAGTLNVDKSAAQAYDSATDGLLVMRYMFGVRGAGLTANVVAPSALRNDPVAIAASLDNMRSALDVDNDGVVNALTDGILIIRYMSGMRGAALIAGAIGAGANPGTSTAIAARIQALMP